MGRPVEEISVFSIMMGMTSGSISMPEWNASIDCLGAVDCSITHSLAAVESMMTSAEELGLSITPTTPDNPAGDFLPYTPTEAIWLVEEVLGSVDISS